MAVKSVVALPNLGRGFELDIGASKINVAPSADAGNVVSYGTDNLLYAPAISAVLPVPSITLRQYKTNPATINPNGVDHILATDGNQINPVRLPFFTAIELSDALLFPSADLRLELLVYGRSGKPNLPRRRGFAHPTHEGGISITGAAPVATLLPRSRFRGGSRSFFPGATTEWSITRNTEQFYVDSLAQWLTRRNLAYRDISNTNQTLDMYMQTGSSGASSGAVGRGFGYSALMRGVRFAFRFSVADPADPRNRLNGPMTSTFLFATAAHPMLENRANSELWGRTVNDLNPLFVATKYNTWIGGERRTGY